MASRYKTMMNIAKKTVLNTVRGWSDESITVLRNCPCGMFRIVIALKLIEKKLV